MPAHSIIPVAKIYQFEDGDIRVVLEANGQYSAINAEDFNESSPIGWGFSEFDAMANLNGKLARAESDREERDHMADRFDHTQDHRKNWER